MPLRGRATVPTEGDEEKGEGENRQRKSDELEEADSRKQHCDGDGDEWMRGRVWSTGRVEGVCRSGQATGNATPVPVIQAADSQSNAAWVGEAPRLIRQAQAGQACPPGVSALVAGGSVSPSQWSAGRLRQPAGGKVGGGKAGLALLQSFQRAMATSPRCSTGTVPVGFSGHRQRNPCGIPDGGFLTTVAPPSGRE